MSEQARRGLGRGLSALLGESFDLNRAQPVPAPTEAPRPTDSPYTEAPSNLAPFPPPRAADPAPAYEPYQPDIDDVADPALDAFAPAPAPAPAAVPVANAAEAGPRLIPIELIQRNPSQPRQHFDEAELQDLADSIRRHGVLQPILVRPLSGSAERYEIVAGERRWRAAQRAGLHALPVVVRELDEAEVLEIAIIENVQRSDLNPIEEAVGYSQLMTKFGRTQQDVAEVVGKSRPHIANMLRLLTLPAAIQEMVRDGRLSAGHARACVTAPDPIGLAKRAVAEQLNVRDIERLASEAKDVRAGVVRQPSPSKDADTRQMEEKIGAALGLAVTISHKGDAGGELRVSYKTLEQLDEVARRLQNSVI
ncbi:MAG: ParB/RepB/Spo0J family partition protein [Alphaproteobacteria bacterium]